VVGYASQTCADAHAVCTLHWMKLHGYITAVNKGNHTCFGCSHTTICSSPVNMAKSQDVAGEISRRRSLVQTKCCSTGAANSSVGGSSYGPEAHSQDNLHSYTQQRCPAASKHVAAVNAEFHSMSYTPEERQQQWPCRKGRRPFKLHIKHWELPEQEVAPDMWLNSNSSPQI
jgi:hypothetical protein